MRTLILVLAGLLGSILSASAASDDDISTARLLNGHAWLSMTTPQKVAYLRGIYDGVLWARYILVATKVSQADDVLNQVQIKSMTFGEIASALDSFYADTSNVQVPVALAHEWLKHKVGGASRQALDAEATQLRSMFSKEGTSK
jgi:hypothetical protein